MLVSALISAFAMINKRVFQIKRLGQEKDVMNRSALPELCVIIRSLTELCKLT